jgi:hypothetical protein
LRSSSSTASSAAGDALAVHRPADDFFIDPAGVATIAADLVKQDRAAWSFEVEARPFKEKW